MDRGRAARGSTAHWSEGEEGGGGTKHGLEQSAEAMAKIRGEKSPPLTAVRKLLHKSYSFSRLIQNTYGLTG